MPAKVLDSFALIAYFRNESGAEMIENLLLAAERQDSRLHMTEVNYAEVKYSILKKDGRNAWIEAAKILRGLPIDFHAATHELADTAAEYKSRYKISLADAFAAALSKSKNIDLVTGDSEFKALEKEIKIAWLK